MRLIGPCSIHGVIKKKKHTKLQVENPEGRITWGNQDENGKMILKLILNK